MRTINNKIGLRAGLGSIALALLLLLSIAPAAVASDDADCNASDELLKTDPGRAVAACSRLAERGDAIAQYNLGLMYLAGQGVNQDYGQAAKWFRKAAEQGYVYAQSILGFMYGTGEGVPTDYVAAYLWLSLAAAAGDDDASAYRDFMEKGMAPEQVTEARRRLNAWKPKKPGDSLSGY
jgi:TPR repeat protein